MTTLGWAITLPIRAVALCFYTVSATFLVLAVITHSLAANLRDIVTSATAVIPFFGKRKTLRPH